MKENLLTEKEMVFLVLLYFHVTTMISRYFQVLNNIDEKFVKISAAA